MTDERRSHVECIDAGTLAAFIDGRLTADERPPVEQHLAQCEGCYEVWMEARALPHPGTSAVPTSTASHRWWFGALAAVLVGMMAIPWLRPDAADRTELVDFARAVGTQRTIVPRVAGPFAWAEPPAPSRAADRPVSLPPDADIALARLRQNLARERSARSLAALGAARLVYRDLDAAIALLEEATDFEDAAAAAWSDLAAAYLERAAAPAYAVDIPLAVEAAEMALRKRPDMPEALFNLGLAHELLNLNPLATWDRFLQVDGTSPWAAEVRDRMARWRDRPATANRDLQSGREQALFDLTLRWADSPLGNVALRNEVQLSLDELAKSEDTLAADVWRHLWAVEQSRGSTEPLRDGIRTLHEGWLAYGANDFQRALPILVRADRTLASERSPLWMVAALHLGLTQFRLRDLAGARSTLAGLARLAPRTAASIVAQAESNLGLTSTGAQRIVEAFDHYQRAHQGFERAGETARAAFVLGLLATNFDLRGDPIRSWEYRLRALSGTSREGTWLAAAEAAHRMGWSHVGVAFQDAAVAHSRQRSGTPGHADALRLAAMGHAGHGRFAQSLALLAEADLVVGQLRDATAASRMRAELAVARAEIAAAGGLSSEIGLEAVASASRYFDSPTTASRLPALSLARAKILLRENRRAEALADLLNGLTRYEAALEGMPDDTSVASYSSVLRRLADRAAQIQIDIGEPLQALSTLARIKGLGLGPIRGDLSLASLISSVPSRTVLTVFLLTDDRSYVWGVREGRTEFRQLDISPARLRQLARGVGMDRFDRTAAEALHAGLLGPIANLIHANDALVIVPDGVLHTVPFAALPQANGRALVESHSISISPRLDIAHTVPRASPAALVVGDPDFDLQSFAGLPRLPGAAREAAGVAHVYGNRATLLTGADATRETFLRLIPAAGVVHFAGHTVVNDRVPGQSQLVIGSGVRAIDLESLNLSGRPVVVLASCESLRGVETASEGPLGLARSLLRAGSSAVIANYWPVDDEHLSGLMTKFHRLLDQGHAPAEALSAAQRDLLSSDLTLRDRPAHWAGVVAIIGSQPTQHPVTSPGASRQ